MCIVYNKTCEYNSYIVLLSLMTELYGNSLPNIEFLLFTLNTIITYLTTVLILFNNL